MVRLTLEKRIRLETLLKLPVGGGFVPLPTRTQIGLAILYLPINELT